MEFVRRRIRAAFAYMAVGEVYSLFKDTSPEVLEVENYGASSVMDGFLDSLMDRLLDGTIDGL